MSQKRLNHSYSSQFFSLLLPFGVTLICLSLNAARGESTEVPGPAIARLSIPSMPLTGQSLYATGTIVGEKVIDLNQKTQNIEANVTAIGQSMRDIYEKTITETNAYYQVISEIEAKLQLGTTPANPHLRKLHQKALLQLEIISKILFQTTSYLERLSKHFFTSKDLSSHAEALLSMPGAVDEDHAHLFLIVDELTTIHYGLGKTMNILKTNTVRQNRWLQEERVRLTYLASDIQKGKILTKGNPIPKNRRPITLLTPAPISSLSHRTEAASIKHNLNKKEVPPTEKLTQHSLPPLSQSSRSPSIENVSHSAQEEIAPLSIKPHETVLPKINVPSRPKVRPLSEEGTVFSPNQSSPTNLLLSYNAVAKERFPLGSLDSHESPQSKKWFLFSSAKRGLQGKSGTIEMVEVIDQENTSSARGEEVRNILIQMGIKPEQLRLIFAKGEKNQVGKVFIFGEK